ncbi:MAG: 23S rRNA (pseudouridine(1915)-N(3))-methyltransferase RlmH [Erysipelotrichaceae bacterium]|nr:23S rRNA (pseudouridine(1915)-N(3))-methyltransferase RlmH [Erysipelotrichaceae bacterium]
MEFHVLASGSKGNATFVYENGCGILIDCGITRKQLLYKLSTLGFNEDDIQYVLLTHDHYDHNKNIHIFNPDKVFSAPKNIPGIDDYHTLIPYTHRQFGPFDVFTLRTSHDASDPIGFIFTTDETLLYLTDTGYVSQKNKQYIHNLNYYIIESNHDIEMLMNTKRLEAYSHVEIIEVEDERIPNNSSLAQETFVKAKEGRRVLDKVKQDDYMILLDVNGKEMDSIEFSKHLEKCMIDGKSSIVFVIGGSLGHGEEVLSRANLRLSFSPMTFPHQLMRLILVEQIYRAFKIMRHETYHK